MFPPVFFFRGKFWFWDYPGSSLWNVTTYLGERSGRIHTWGAKGSVWQDSYMKNGMFCSFLPTRSFEFFAVASTPKLIKSLDQTPLP